MRESDFIKQNVDKWEEVEELTKRTTQNPKKVHDLYIKLTDDLSYARTYFKNRSVRAYLNTLGQSTYFAVHKGQKSRWHHLIDFWKTDLPLALYEARKSLMWAAIAFFGAVLVGVLSTIWNPDFPRAILGDSYVDMTLENIAKGDPMAVYKDADVLGMSLRITLNNLAVDIMTFAIGIFYGFGSICILILNGVMVGAFQYFFISKGVVWDSLLTIWMHGMLEMSAAVIAGGAGLVLGRGLAYPGTYSRIKSLQIAARQAFKIFLGILPLTMIAGFIEGFITRMTYLPYALRLVFILACFLFVIGYFVIYPFWLVRRKKNLNTDEFALAPEEEEYLDLYELESFGQVFMRVFQMMRVYFSKWIKWAFVIAGVYIFGSWLFAKEGLSESYEFGYSSFSLLEAAEQVLATEGNLWFQVGGAFLYAALLTLVLSLIWYYHKQESSALNEQQSYVEVLKGHFPRLLIAYPTFLASAYLLYGLWQLPFFLAWIGIAGMWFMLVLVGFIQLIEGVNIIKGTIRLVELFDTKLLSYMSTVAAFILLACFISWISDEGIMQILTQLIGFILPVNASNSEFFGTVFYLILIWVWFGYFTVLIAFTVGLSYFRLVSVKEGVAVKKLVADFGVHKQIRGLERE